MHDSAFKRLTAALLLLIIKHLTRNKFVAGGTGDQPSP
jgi:hypothetical protein